MGNTCETKLNNLQRSILEVQLFKTEDGGELESGDQVRREFADIILERQHSGHHARSKQKSIDTSYYKLASIDENVQGNTCELMRAYRNEIPQRKSL